MMAMMIITINSWNIFHGSPKLPWMACLFFKLEHWSCRIYDIANHFFVSKEQQNIALVHWPCVPRRAKAKKRKRLRPRMDAIVMKPNPYHVQLMVKCICRLWPNHQVIWCRHLENRITPGLKPGQQIRQLDSFQRLLDQSPWSRDDLQPSSWCRQFQCQW